jgi:hypothetical protein
LQSLAPAPISRRVDVRQTVKIVAETSLSGIRVYKKKSKKAKSLNDFLIFLSLDIEKYTFLAGNI